MEDKHIGEGEEHAVAETREWRKRNEPIPHEEVLADFGLTMADFERMGGIPLDPNSSHSREIELRSSASGIAKTLIGEPAGLILNSLFVSQGVDWVQAAGFERGEEAGDQADDFQYQRAGDYRELR